MAKHKNTWERVGANDPYYAVATFEKFHQANLNDDLVSEFFETGYGHVESLWCDIREGFDVDFRPKNALDFGCGVGRITLAMADRCERVVGIDISESMLAEARKNCQNRNISNVDFRSTDEFFRSSGDMFDFVHSYIVLQHIEPVTGIDAIANILERLSPEGIGMLHVTYHDPSALFQKLRLKAYRKFPFIYSSVNRLRRRKVSHRLFPMYKYDLGRIFTMLKANECENIFVRLTDHGMLGAMLFFQRSQNLRKY
ncbi:MAG: class I SAM-dependent methyltransferase [Pyrinomonadaceae bacterium]